MAVSWQADFHQLSTADSITEIFQARLGDTLLSSARFGCFVEQQGATPQGMRTFAIMDRNAPPMNWFGHQVGPDSLLIFPASGEIDAISRPGFAVSTFSLSEAKLKSGLAGYTGRDPEKLISRHEAVVYMPGTQRKKLRNLLHAATRTALLSSNAQLQHFTLPEFENQLLMLLSEALSNGTDRMVKNGLANDAALKRVLAFSRAHIHEALNVSDLCEVARTSERNLQYKFAQQLGMAPKAFLMGQRLYNTHRQLLHSSASWKTVSETANDSGFSHLGQFTAHYKRLFEELPSTTLKRSIH